MTSPRGLILDVEDSSIYLLNVGPDAAKLVGRLVTVEGFRSGLYRLDVDWIGEASSSNNVTPPCV